MFWWGSGGENMMCCFFSLTTVAPCRAASVPFAFGLAWPGLALIPAFLSFPSLPFLPHETTPITLEERQHASDAADKISSLHTRANSTAKETTFHRYMTGYRV